MEAGRGKEKPQSPLMISAQKVRIRPGKGKGNSGVWFPQPRIHNTRRVCTDNPKKKLPMHSLCPTREWEREWYRVTTPNIISGQGVILFPFGATPPLISKAEEVAAAETLRAFNRDPNDLVLTVGGRLVVRDLMEHTFLSDVQLQSLLDNLDRVPLIEKAPFFNENPPAVGSRAHRMPGALQERLAAALLLRGFPGFSLSSKFSWAKICRPDLQMAPTRDNPMSLLSAAVNLILAQMSLLQRLETSYLLSSLPYFPRLPVGYASSQPSWPTPSPQTTQCPARYRQRTAYGQPWGYACRDYGVCINACFPLGKTALRKGRSTSGRPIL